jgi:hypothetical protein
MNDRLESPFVCPAFRRASWLAIGSVLLTLVACSGEEAPAPKPPATASAPKAETTADASVAEESAAAKAEALERAVQPVAVAPAEVKTEPAVTRPTEAGDGHDGHDHAKSAEEGATPVAEGDAAARKATGPAPRLESDASDHDFGTAIEGEILAHTFKLRSTGAADLLISNAKPTCGCTVAKLEVKKADGTYEAYKYNDPLPPGAELDLVAQLDTKNKHNVASSKVNVYCNDPRQVITLGLTARVDTYFQITPNALQFGNVSVADQVEKTFQVAGKKAGSFALSLDPKPLPDGMKVELAPVEPDPDGKANRWDVKVTIGPNCKEGMLGYPIALRSDEKVAGAAADKEGKSPTYGATVMVTAKVQGLISFEPQYLSFGLVRPGLAAERSLTVKTYDPAFTFPADLKVRLVGPSDQKPEFPYASSFSHAVKASEDNKALTVTLTLNGLPDTVDGSFQGRLMLETGHPSKPEVAVLFSGVCRAGPKAATTQPPAVQPQPPQPTGGR